MDIIKVVELGPALVLAILCASCARTGSKVHGGTSQFARLLQVLSSESSRLGFFLVLLLGQAISM